MDFIQSLLPAISHFHLIGYWVAFFIALFETTIIIGLFLPGSTILLFMGALAAGGYFDIGDLLWFAIAGAVVGDNINYLIGKRYGSKLFAKGFWFIKPTHFEKGREFFKNHGSKSIFFGRLIPSLKEIIPLIAGSFKMKRLSFMVWNILGGIMWSLVWILPGYFFAQSLDMAKIWLTRAGFFITILIIIFVIFYLLKILFTKKGEVFYESLSSFSRSLRIYITKNKKVQQFIGNHKSFFQFIKNRINKSKFFGLPLTLFSIALLYVFSLLGGIIEDIVNSDLIVSVDVKVASLLAIFRNTDITQFFLWVTLLGKWQVILIFTISTLVILWVQNKRHYITPLLLSIIGSATFTYLGKIIFHRQRPDVAIYIEHSFSFPSGHATIAVAFYGFLTYILLKNTNQWKREMNIFFTAIVLILLIGFSRLYLGVHYLSDVWGGYLVGLIWLIIAISLAEYFSYKKQEQPKQTRKIKITTVVITLLAISLYIIFAFNNQIHISNLPKQLKTISTNNTLAIFYTKNSKYTETLLGDKREPIDFIILSKGDKQLINVFKKAGWYKADNINASNIIKMISNILQKKSYPSTPIAPDFWDSNVNNFGFEKTSNMKNIKTKYIIYFWKTNYITKSGYNIYVGATSFNKTTKVKTINGVVGEADTAREFLFNEIKNKDNITNIQKIQFSKPSLTKKYSNNPFFTDGKLYFFFID